jgi:signal transduction histidine kinase
MTAMTTAEMTDRLRSSIATARDYLRRSAGSARGRILASYVVLLLFASIVSVMAIRAILIDRFNDRIEETFVQEIREFQRLVDGRNPRTGRYFRGDLRAIFNVYFGRNVPAEGEQVIAFLRGEPFRSTETPTASYQLTSDEALVERWATLTETETGEVDSPVGPARYAALPVTVGGDTKGSFVVASFIASERAEVDQALQVAGGAAIGVLIVGSIVAFFAAGRVLAPLGKLTETAREITESDLTKRIEVHGDDELAEQARTFNAMLERLEAAFESQRSLIRDVGHELRTPITIVRGNLEFLDADEDPEERQETIELVMDELDRISRLVDELLLLARSERPDFLELETVSLGTLSDELFAKASALGDRNWQLESRGGGMIVADRQRLTQAVMSLAQNAVQQTSEGDTIVLGTDARGGQARLWVRDWGPGIAPEEQGQVFERFARGRDGRNYEGTGLGLAIVKAIAEAHGGDVELSSSLGAGARFTIAVPVDHGPVGAADSRDGGER